VVKAQLPHSPISDSLTIHDPLGNVLEPLVPTEADELAGDVFGIVAPDADPTQGFFLGIGDPVGFIQDVAKYLSPTLRYQG